MVERRDDVDDTVIRGATETQVVEEEHAFRSPPVVRGLTTLLGVAAAGFLVWLASTFDLSSTGEYWAAIGILVGAGICLGASQLLGGWTKWGRPTISGDVLFLAFLPTLVAVAGMLIATRPTGTEEGNDVAGWIRDIGLGGVAEDLSVFQGILAFGLGIVFTFTFDTRGPRRAAPARETTALPDEDVHDYRTETVAAGEEETVVVRRTPE